MVNFGVREKEVGLFGPTSLCFKDINVLNGVVTVLMAEISALIPVATVLIPVASKCRLDEICPYFCRCFQRHKTFSEFYVSDGGAF